MAAAGVLRASSTCAVIVDVGCSPGRKKDPCLSGKLYISHRQNSQLHMCKYVCMGSLLKLLVGCTRAVLTMLVWSRHGLGNLSAWQTGRFRDFRCMFWSTHPRRRLFRRTRRYHDIQGVARQTSRHPTAGPVWANSQVFTDRPSSLPLFLWPSLVHSK